MVFVDGINLLQRNWKHDTLPYFGIMNIFSMSKLQYNMYNVHKTQTQNLHYIRYKLTSASNWGGPSTLLCPDKPCPGKSNANISIGWWWCSCRSSDKEGESSSKGANRLNDAALSNQPWRHNTFFVDIILLLFLLTSPALMLLHLLTTSLTPSLQVKVRSDVEMVLMVMMLRALFVSRERRASVRFIDDSNCILLTPQAEVPDQ